MNRANRFRPAGPDADNRINWIGALWVALLAMAASAALIEADRTRPVLGMAQSPAVVAPAAARAVALGVKPKLQAAVAEDPPAARF